MNESGRSVGRGEAQLAGGGTWEKTRRRREPQAVNQVNVCEDFGFVGTEEDPSVNLVDLARSAALVPAEGGRGRGRSAGWRGRTLRA
jgi:hypothetical protein